MQTCERSRAFSLQSRVSQTQYDFSSLFVQTIRMKGVVPASAAYLEEVSNISCLGYGFRLHSLTLGLLISSSAKEEWTAERAVVHVE